MDKLHIFDIDGTVLDSMPMWENLPTLFLERRGIEAPADLAETVDHMSVPETNEYIAETFGIEGGAEAVMSGMNEVLKVQYDSVLEPFDGIIDELRELSDTGARMIVFSNTPHVYLDRALERHDLMKFFERVYAVEDIGVRKDNSKSYEIVCQDMGFDTADAILYDDSDYALNAAKEAGLEVKKYDRYRGIGKQGLKK